MAFGATINPGNGRYAHFLPGVYRKEQKRRLDMGTRRQSARYFPTSGLGVIRQQSGQSTLPHADYSLNVAVFSFPSTHEGLGCGISAAEPLRIKLRTRETAR